ncbi:hypothetical protein WG908_09730, partial [Sphingobium sp. AN641]|uniref:hypothetical protein n=1 Tax=Sphingobium sp. AN641 TaxID=3133443 RepID=UPI0030C21EEB
MPNVRRALYAHTNEYPSGGTFARLLDWHLVYWNTCPDCSITKRNPQNRTLKDFAYAIHLRVPPVKTDDNPERKLRYWRAGPRIPDLPQIIEDICFHLFGEDENLAEWKNDLIQAYDRERLAKLKEDNSN